MSGLAFQKPSRGDALRAKRTRKNAAASALSALYRCVYQRDGYRCVACRKPVVVGALEEWKRTHPHHIIPRSLASKAVKHTSQNVCTVCPFCHSDIHDKRLFITGDANKTLKIRRTT